MKCLVMTKILFHAPCFRENKAVRENWRVKMCAVAGYHAVVCDAFIDICKGDMAFLLDITSFNIKD